MRSLREVVWSLVGASAVGLAICACGASDTGTQEPVSVSEPAGSGEVHRDMTNVGCKGAAGCPCSPSSPCTEPDTFCNGHPDGICALTTPCGNCSPSSSGSPGGNRN